MFLHHVCFMVLIIAGVALDFKVGDYCVTPNGEKATCTKRSRCDVLNKLLDDEDPREADFRMKSKCGSTTLVCCGTRGPPNEPTIDSTEQIILSKYSNIHCGRGGAVVKILGGEKVQPGDFPWLAALEYQSKLDGSNAGIKCGGSLITRKYVLTAAHCIESNEFTVIKAWLGVTDITSDQVCTNVDGREECIPSAKKLRIVHTVAHPHYHSLDHFNDVGLLRLESPVGFSKFIRPICLPETYSATPEIGSKLTVAGWGATENHQQSNVTLQVMVPVQSYDDCIKAYKLEDEVILASQHLCVGGQPQKDSCEGDSGGPLIQSFKNKENEIQWYQVGLVSYGTGCGVRGRPGIYAKIFRYVNWIRSKIFDWDLGLGKNDTCKTLTGESGTCVPLSTCQVLFDAIATKNTNEYDYAKKSFCGYDDEVLVCCKSPGTLKIRSFQAKTIVNPTDCGVRNKFVDFPWIVSIEYKSKITNYNEGIRCAGSLISSRYVITSAHCLVNVEFLPINVLLGKWNVTVNSKSRQLLADGEHTDQIQKVPIKNLIPHVFYSQKYVYDNIGLILLEREVKFTDFIMPICLPFGDIPSPDPQTNMTVVGWRTTEYPNSTLDVLQAVEVPLISHEECVKKLSSYVFLSPRQLCAGGQNISIRCKWDAGAPLMRTYEDTGGSMQYYLEGVVSYEKGCGIGSPPTVYTRISSYMNWITNVISKH